MKPSKEKVMELPLHDLKLIHSIENNSTFTQPGSYLWRKEKGLQVISDYISDYRARRVPRGSYQIPLQEDLI